MWFVFAPLTCGALLLAGRLALSITGVTTLALRVMSVRSVWDLVAFTVAQLSRSPGNADPDVQ